MTEPYTHRVFVAGAHSKCFVQQAPFSAPCFVSMQSFPVQLVHDSTPLLNTDTAIVSIVPLIGYGQCRENEQDNTLAKTSSNVRDGMSIILLVANRGGYNG
jgi:hypothetical protein